VTSTIQWAYLHGYKFELYDTIDTLLAIEDGAIQIHQPMADRLKNIKVIESNGSRRSGTGATKGENFDAFLKSLRDRRDRIDDES
jgi:hypothetical protein